MLYPKIHSLYKRSGCGEWIEDQGRYACDVQKKPRYSPLIIGDYSCAEFESINRWMIDEKVDGTNIRITWEPSNELSPTFGGRSDNAMIPPKLLLHLQKTFTREKMLKFFPMCHRAVFFGEGYGPKIQGCGSRYRKEVSFILFDVHIDGWWLQKDCVLELANQMDIEHTINQQILTTQEVVDFVRSKPISYIAEDRSLVMEGVIARSYPLMLFRQRQLPIMFKLKCRDFDE